MSQVVVIGAGIGGLAAAARLAALGHRVTVCEAAPVVGGKLGRAEVVVPEGRFEFDTGATLLTLPQVFADLFRATGGRLEDAVRLHEVDPACEYHFSDGTTLVTTRDPAEQVRRFEAAFGAAAARGWSRLMEIAARMWAVSEEPVLRSPLTLRGTLRRARRPGDIGAVRPGQSLRTLGMRHLPDIRLRMILDRYATYAGSDPRRVPAALAVIPYLEREFGCWSVDGGLGRLADALADHATGLGAVVRTSCRVRSIDVAGGRVHGVTLAAGSRLTADIVVSDADAACLYGSLLGPQPGRRRTPRADSSAGFVLLLGLRGVTPPATAQNSVLFGASDIDAEFDALFARPGRLVRDPMIYVHRSTDLPHCPPWHEAWFVMVNAPRHGPGGVDWDEPGRADAYALRVLDLLTARGLPARERLLFHRILTPADLERSALAPGGAIYGSAMHGALAPWRRPRNAARVRGLYLVGGSAHPGGGLPLVALSAEIVAGLVGPAV